MSGDDRLLEHLRARREAKATPLVRALLGVSDAEREDEPTRDDADESQAGAGTPHTRFAVLTAAS